MLELGVRIKRQASLNRNSTRSLASRQNPHILER